MLGVVRDANHAKTVWQQTLVELQLQANQLKSEVQNLSDVASMEAIGVHQRQYASDVPQIVKAELERNLENQKQMIRQGLACSCPIEWQVEGSVEKGRKMINDKINLMLRAFNGECDAAIAKVNFGNMSTMEARIIKAFKALNKLGEMNQVSLSPSYLDLRLAELKLVHRYEQAKEAERERHVRSKRKWQRKEGAARNRTG